MKVAVVGAGIMGRLMAWRLLSRGWQVTVFDANPLDSGVSCSHVAAGMLSPYAEVETAMSGIVSLGVAALPIWRDYLAQLPEQIMHGHKGSIILSHARDSQELTRFMGILRQRAPESQSVQRLDQNSLGQLEPGLRDFRGEGYYFSEEGFIDSQALMGALCRLLCEGGVLWRANTFVERLSSHCVCAKGEKTKFDWVFDCRGLGAGDRLPLLRGVRGELIHVHAPEVTLQRPVRMMHPRYRIYLVPRRDNHYIVGASEVESEDMSTITVRTLLELLSAVFSVSSGFSEARVIKTVAHCRPALPDNMPKIITQPGLVAINGLYRHGFLLAPVLVELVLDYICNGTLEESFPGIIEEVRV